MILQKYCKKNVQKMSKNMFLTSVRKTHPGIPISGFDPLRLDNRKVETEVSPSGQVDDAPINCDL